MNISKFLPPQITASLVALMLMWSNSTQALLLSEAESIINWDSFTISTTGDLQLSFFNEQTVTSYWNNVTQTGGGDRYFDWNAHSDGFNNSVGVSSAVANDSELNAYSYTERSAPGNTYFQTTSNRGAFFTTTGSGTLSLSASFSLNPNTLNTDVAGSLAIARTDVSLSIADTSLTDENGDLIVLYNSFAYTEFATPDDLFSFMIIDDVLQESVSSYPDIWTGQLTISMDFTDGQEGVLNLRSHSEVETRIPEPQVSIPEPASLFLFGAGLFGILRYRKTKKIAERKFN